MIIMITMRDMIVLMVENVTNKDRMPILKCGEDVTLNIIAVGLGSLIGAVLRYLIGLIPVKEGNGRYIF